MPCTEAFVNVHGIRVHSSSQIGQTHASDLWLCGNFSVTGTTTSSHCLKMQACTRSNLPNVGKSDRIPGLAAGLKATADRVAATIEALGPDHADIAGHSHGGAVALMLAVRHPERVRSLILFALALIRSNCAPVFQPSGKVTGKVGALCAAYNPKDCVGPHVWKSCPDQRCLPDRIHRGFATARRGGPHHGDRSLLV